jgi:hypothetical protein
MLMLHILAGQGKSAISSWNKEADMNKSRRAWKTKDAKQIPQVLPTAERHRVFSHCAGEA